MPLLPNSNRVDVVVEEVSVVCQHIWIAKYPSLHTVFEFFVLMSTQLSEVPRRPVVLGASSVHEAPLHFLCLWNSMDPQLTIAGPSRFSLIIELNLLMKMYRLLCVDNFMKRYYVKVLPGLFK